MWSWIIEQYSATALSVPTDKLVALSGIAIHDQTGDQCEGLRKGCRCLVTGLYSMKKLPYARVEFIYVW
jgi:hypothetical protein